MIAKVTSYRPEFMSRMTPSCIRFGSRRGTPVRYSVDNTSITSIDTQGQDSKHIHTFLTFFAAFEETKGLMIATKVFSPLVGRTSTMYLTFLRNGLDRERYADMSHMAGNLLEF